jgi:hypothetical protein
VRDRDLVSVSTCGYPVFQATFDKEAVFSPSCVLGSFVKNQLAEKPHVFSHMWIIDLIQIQEYYEKLVTLRGGHV